MVLTLSPSAAWALLGADAICQHGQARQGANTVTQHILALLRHGCSLRGEKNSIFKGQKKNNRISSSPFVVQGSSKSCTQTLPTIITYPRVSIIQNPYTKIEF